MNPSNWRIIGLISCCLLFVSTVFLDLLRMPHIVLFELIVIVLFIKKNKFGFYLGMLFGVYYFLLGFIAIVPTFLGDPFKTSTPGAPIDYGAFLSFRILYLFFLIFSIIWLVALIKSRMLFDKKVDSAKSAIRV